MRKIILLIILIIFIYFLTAEQFTSYNYIKLYNRVPWATYSSMDGSFLNLTFRESVRRIDVNFSTPAYCELWGYVGSGVPEAEDKGNFFVNPNWELLFFNKNIYKNSVYFRRLYKAYHIVLVY
jgi:hypothetical protein